MYAYIATLFLQTVVEDVSWRRYKKKLQSMTHLDKKYNDPAGVRKKIASHLKRYLFMKASSAKSPVINVTVESSGTSCGQKYPV